MVLSQAEQEGYSVFCVRKLSKGPEEEGEDGEGEGWGDGGVAVLPDCQADMFATQLGEPQGRTGGSLAQMSRGVIAGCEPRSCSPLLLRDHAGYRLMAEMKLRVFR